MNVTYFFGAGASAAAIPPVGEKFNERFILFCQLLLKYIQRSNSGPILHGTFIGKAAQELPKHYSVDTYARKLFFQDKSEYEAFKLLLSAYFLFEQMGGKTHELQIVDGVLEQNFNITFPYNRKKLDPRYDVLYAALLDESKKQLPDNIHFISWNYDVQFELSLAGFLNMGINHAFRDLKVYPSPFGRADSDLAKAQFLKLNGIAGLVYKQEGSTSSYVFDSPDSVYLKPNMETTLNDIHGILKGESGKYESMLHFAWENKPEISQARKRANEILRDADVIVVIGYSFPLYNRRIDREIFRSLRTPKIYLQVPENRFEEISERFTTVMKNSHKITLRKDLDQFFIPDEVI